METEPTELAEAYRAARGRIAEVLDGAEGEADRTVPACPAWRVRDLVAHLAGVPADLIARRNPGADLQGWVDGHVAARADVPVQGLLDEWDRVGPDFEALIERRPASFGGLVYDVVAHEHDLRHALGRPGARDSRGVVLALDVACRLLAADLATHDLASVRLVVDGDERIVGEGEIGLSIEGSAFELLRLLGSRRSRAQVLDAPWIGDVERFLPALAHMPLPADDLVE